MSGIVKGLSVVMLTAAVVSCVSDHEIAELETTDGAGGSSNEAGEQGSTTLSLEPFCEAICVKQRECPEDVYPSWCGEYDGGPQLPCDDCEAGCLEELEATVDLENEFCRIAVEDSLVCFEEASCREVNDPEIGPASCDSANRAGEVCLGGSGQEYSGGSSSSGVTVSTASVTTVGGSGGSSSVVTASGTGGSGGLERVPEAVTSAGGGMGAGSSWMGDVVSVTIDDGRGAADGVGLSGTFSTASDQVDGGESTISPATFAGAGDEICVSGVAAQVLDEQYAEYWGAELSFDFVQSAADEPTAWDLGEHSVAGFGFTIDELPQLEGQVRFEVFGEDESLYCTVIVDTGHNQFLLEDITQDCWVSGGAVPSGPILSLKWWIVTNDATSYPFEFCITDLEVLVE